MLWRPDGGLKTKPIENRIVQEAGPGKGPASFLFRRALAAGVVDGVIGAVFPGEDQLADGHDVVALLKEVFQDAGQGLRGVEGGVVEEDDGPGADLGGHPVGDGGGIVVLPVQAVPAGSGCKGLGGKAFEVASSS